MNLLFILFLIIGLIAGGLIAYFWGKSSQVVTNEEADALKNNHQEALQTISRLKERNEYQSRQLEETEHKKTKAEGRAHQAETDYAKITTINQHLREKLATQKEEMQDLQKQFHDEFENLATKILERNSEKFTRHNKEKMDQLLKPLSEKMETFKKKVEETYEKETRENTSLKEQIRQMAELNKRMTDEAKNLTKALKNDPKTQGRWGEVILQRILEKSGLAEGREYNTQVGAKSAAGGQQYLDVLVNLPDEKIIIIDSKVSLKAYEQFIEAEDEIEKERALKNHTASVRRHVKNLSGKNYHQLYSVNSPDFVLLFVPIESAFGLALQNDNSLYYDAFEKNIVIVSPSTLLAALGTIDSVWKQEYQSKNAQEIAERGGKLYDKFVNFVGSMENIGQRIHQTQDSYDEAMGQLSEGRGNVVRQVEKLRELGAKNSKKLPKKLTENGQNKLADPSKG
jgi:DNA recombination protein RmuC